MTPYALRASATSAGSFTWSDALGCGFLAPARPAAAIYDAAYFEKYVGLAATPLGSALDLARCSLVMAHARPAARVLDVGCGSGSFVRHARARGVAAYGCDVMPEPIDALGPWAERAPLARPRGFYSDATFWDSLEHLDEPWSFLDAVGERVYAAVPVFEDEEDVRTSRHFKPDEHLWYFTRLGFVRFMDGLGWSVREVRDTEERLGRESIASFVFYRRRTP